MDATCALWRYSTPSYSTLPPSSTQTLIASSLSAGDSARARAVVSRSLMMAVGLGAALAGVLFVFRHAIAKVSRGLWIRAGICELTSCSPFHGNWTECVNRHYATIHPPCSHFATLTIGQPLP